MSSADKDHLSRRGFMKGTVTGAALLGGTAQWAEEVRAGADGYYPAPGSSLLQYDFTRQSGALQPDQVVASACQFCNSLCRLKVHLKDGRVIDIQGEPDDPVQAGGLCVKGPMMAQLVYNRFRLQKPMKRVGGEKGSPDSKFEAISWDDALGMIAEKFLALRDGGAA